MPRIWLPRPRRSKPGKPPLQVSKPEMCIEAALMKDFSRMSYIQVERSLSLVGDNSRRHGHTVEGYVAVGRQLLHYEGVLPWACWNLRVMRERDVERWWSSDPFLDALATWAAECHARELRRLGRGFRSIVVRSRRRDPQAQVERERRLALRHAKQVCPTQEITDDDRLIAEDVAFCDELHQGTAWRHDLSYDDLLAHAKYMAGAGAEVEWEARRKRLNRTG